MPTRPIRIYWDSSVFLSYINGDPDRLPTIDALLAQASESKVHIVSSVISIAEVVFAAEEQEQRELDPQVVERIESILYDRSVVTLVEVTPTIARNARDIQRDGKFAGRSVKPMDALHLATATSLDPPPSEIHTYDSSWPRWAEALGIAVVEPRADQPRLMP